MSKLNNLLTNWTAKGINKGFVFSILDGAFHILDCILDDIFLTLGIIFRILNVLHSRAKYILQLYFKVYNNQGSKIESAGHLL